jgi:hypothetical protein
LSGRSVERRSDCGHFGSVDWRTCVRIKVSGHLCIKCSCDLVGWRGDLARVASWRRLGLGRAGSMFFAGGGPRARHRSSGVGCPCSRLGSGEARSPNHPAVILFDSGASHTFISKKFVEKYCIPCIESREGFIIHSPGGKIFTKEMAFHVPVTLVEWDFPTNMIVLKNQDIDVILGMNWLAQHKAILNTDMRTIRLSYG